MTSYPRATMGGGLGGEADAARRLRFSGYLWRRDATRRRARGAARPFSRRSSAISPPAACSSGLRSGWCRRAPPGSRWQARDTRPISPCPPTCSARQPCALADLTRRPASWRFWGTRRLRVADGPRVLRSTADFRAWEKRLADRPEPTLIVYLALHGATDVRNRPCLLVDDVGSGHGFIPLSDVLTRLKAGPLAAKKRLLLLDATGLDSAWHLGILSNDFALALEELNRQIADDPNLIVVSASSPGERSWPAPASGTTAFGRFVVAGLGGAAEVATTVDPLSGEVRKAERLTALDFFRYVRTEVGRRSRTQRGADQTPLMFPRGPIGEARAATWEITTGLEPLPTEAPRTSPPPASAELRAAWGSYQRLLRDDPHPAAYAPQLWTLYQATVLRGDELERSGDPASARVLFERLTSLRRRIDEARILPLGSSTGATLGMPAVEGNWPLSAGKPPGDVASSLWSPPEGTDRAGVWQRVRQNLPDAETRRLRAQLYFQALLRVEDDPARNLGPAVDLIRALDDPSRPRAAEVHDLLMDSKRPAPRAGQAGAIRRRADARRPRPQTCRGSRARHQSARALSL